MIKRYRRRHRLDRGMKFWIMRYARRNHWRVPSHFDVEDLAQEGFVCYCKCLDKYGHLIEQRHLMALVKITFINRVHDLSSECSKNPSVRAVAVSDLTRDDAEVSMDEIAGSVPEEATFRVLVSQLPRELADLLRTLLSDARDPEFERLPRESVNEWLCRLAGIPSKRCDVESMLKQHFGLEESAPLPKGEREMLYVNGELVYQ